MKVGGLIAGHGLEKWWSETFSDEETAAINEFCHAHPGLWLGSSQPRGPTEGPAARDSRSASQVLYELASGQSPFASETMLAKAEELALKRSDVMDLHFTYHMMITSFYRRRNEERYLDKAIEACEKQIAIAPRAAAAFAAEYAGGSLPWHTGFNQLRIVLKKQRRWAEHDALCGEAAAQGWRGRWTLHGGTSK